MHAIVITFTQGLPEREYGALCDSFVASFEGIDGLVAKTFLGSTGEAGGFYLFTDEAAADAYLAGPIVAGLADQPGIGDVTVRRFDVDTARSSRTGLAALVAGAA
jgi:hypothetical protein